MESADMEEQKYAYRGNDIPTLDFIIALLEPGDYCIEINAKDFAGKLWYFRLPGNTIDKYGYPQEWNSEEI